jgi:hypothetical protein
MPFSLRTTINTAMRSIHSVLETASMPGHPNTSTALASYAGPKGIATIVLDAFADDENSPLTLQLRATPISKSLYCDAGEVWFNQGYLQLTEIQPPTPPSRKQARLFLADNGKGKTQLCIRFATGPVRVLASE